MFAVPGYLSVPKVKAECPFAAKVIVSVVSCTSDFAPIRKFHLPCMRPKNYGLLMPYGSLTGRGAPIIPDWSSILFHNESAVLEEEAKRSGANEVAKQRELGDGSTRAWTKNADAPR